MCSRLAKATLFSILALSMGTAFSEEGNLVSHMGNMQTYMHKTALSLDARNPELVYFYTHEIEETIEAVKAIGTFKEYDIKVLIEHLLVPEFGKFEDLVKAQQLDEADAQFSKLVNGCNSCHDAVKRGYIRIQRVSGNPFMQDFGN